MIYSSESVYSPDSHNYNGPADMESSTSNAQPAFCGVENCTWFTPDHRDWRIYLCLDHEKELKAGAKQANSWYVQGETQAGGSPSDVFTPATGSTMLGELTPLSEADAMFRFGRHIQHIENIEDLSIGTPHAGASYAGETDDNFGYPLTRCSAYQGSPWHSSCFSSPSPTPPPHFSGFSSPSSTPPPRVAAPPPLRVDSFFLKRFAATSSEHAIHWDGLFNATHNRSTDQGLPTRKDLGFAGRPMFLMRNAVQKRESRFFPQGSGPSPPPQGELPPLARTPTPSPPSSPAWSRTANSSPSCGSDDLLYDDF